MLASAVPSSKRKTGEETETERGKLKEKAAVITLSFSEYFFHPQQCGAQIVHGLSWRNHKTSTLVCKMNQVWEPANLFLFLYYNKGHILHWWQNEGDRVREALRDFVKVTLLKATDEWLVLPWTQRFSSCETQLGYT